MSAEHLESLDDVARLLSSADSYLKYHQQPESLRLHALGEGSGTLLRLLVIATNAQSVLELGTGYGYSTLWLADGLLQTGGSLVSVDQDKSKQAFAKLLLQRYDREAKVAWHNANAGQFLTTLTTRPDLVLLDLDKSAYLDCFNSLMRLSSKRTTLVVADNLISHRAQLGAFVEGLDSMAEVSHTLVPVGKGLELCLISPVPEGAP